MEKLGAHEIVEQVRIGGELDFDNYPFLSEVHVSTQKPVLTRDWYVGEPSAFDQALFQIGIGPNHVEDKLALYPGLV